MGIKDTKYGSKLETEANGEAHVKISSQVDDYTLKTTDGKHLVVLELQGIPYQTMDSNDLDLHKDQLNNLYMAVQDSKLAIWTTIIRDIEQQYPAGEFKNPFAKALDKAYKQEVMKSDLYVNRIFVTICSKDSSDVVVGLSELLNNLFTKKNPATEQRKRRLDKKRVDEIMKRIAQNLEEYGVRILSSYYRDRAGRKVQVLSENDEPGTDDYAYIPDHQIPTKLKNSEIQMFSEPMEFIGYLINGHWKPFPMGFQNYSSCILGSKITFEKEYYVVQNTEGSFCAQGCTINQYRASTYTGMLNKLLSLPVPFVLTQSFSFKTKQSAAELLKQQYLKMTNAGDLAESQIDELTDAQDQLASNKFAMGDHHLSVFTREKSLKTMRANLSKIENTLSDLSLITAREHLGLEALFWAQIPGNNAYIARPAPITSKNFASFSSFHNYPVGKIDGNHWGSAVALLKTESKTPFYFNFHVEDVGNTVIIGQTGAGKTAIANFLLALLQKHSPTTVIFDKDRGSETFVRALGGNYKTYSEGENTRMNPFKLPESPTVRAFLVRFLERLGTLRNYKIDTVDRDSIVDAVDVNFKLPLEERGLSSILDIFQNRGEDCLKERLREWTRSGDKGYLFDNDVNDVDLNSSVVGFDLTAFMDDEVIRSPIYMYLHFLVDSWLQGKPFVKFQDEGWKTLDDQEQAERARGESKVIRKLNGFNIFATQEPEDMADSKAGRTLISQSPTQIYLYNRQAQRKDYVDVFKLSEREYQIIRKFKKHERKMLIKQGNHSVVCSLDLSRPGLAQFVPVLSGSKTRLALMEKLISEKGHHPRDWLKDFILEAK